jgi:hypothetical protein
LKEFTFRKAKIVDDKLIVDGRMYDPSTHREPPRYKPGLPINQGNNGRLDNTSDTEVDQRPNCVYLPPESSNYS